jgi:GAF domain-containing protein
MARLADTATQIAAGDLGLRAEQDRVDEIGSLASSFNNMTDRLRELIDSLETQVEERTRALAASVEVSRRIATILDPDLLVHAVVEQIKSAFEYYHVHIYLYDEMRETLRLVGGTGETGKALLQAGHKLARGKGLVGRAAENKAVVLVRDVKHEPNWLPNPLLPETRSELAVPIIIGDEVLGVLDVQENRIGGLDQDDAELLQALANQVAIAVQNAQSYSRVQEQAHMETTINEINQRIQAASSVEAVLQTAVRELGRAMKAHKANVVLQRGDGNGHTKLLN